MGIVHLNRDTTLLVSTLPWVPGPEAECGGVAEVQLLFSVDVEKSWRGRRAHHYQGGWWLAPWYLLGKAFDEQDFGGYVDAAPRFKSSMKHVFSVTVGWGKVAGCCTIYLYLDVSESF